MKQPALVLIKPDGVERRLTGHVMAQLEQSGLELVAARVVQVSKDLAEEHYIHLKGKPFFEGTVRLLVGEFNAQQKVLALIYYGQNAIKKLRDLAGATNPEEADPSSIRGQFGRITSQGIFENIIHVSSSPKEAEREIKLWFQPEHCEIDLYPTKKTTDSSKTKRTWA